MVFQHFALWPHLSVLHNVMEAPIHVLKRPRDEVRAEAEVTKSDGRRIEFNVTASDEMEPIGSGTHIRAVVNRAKFDERFAAKVKSRP